MKRVFYLILSLIMLTTFIVIPTAVSAEYDIQSSSEILKGLNIVTDSHDVSVTRREMIDIALKMLNTEGTVCSSESHFTDISKTQQFYNKFDTAFYLGLLSGGNARPYEFATYNELVKVLVCTLGYGEYAVHLGGYPSGYLQAASEIGISKGVKVSGNEFVGRQDAYKMIYNCLDIDCMTIKSVGENVLYTAEKGKNILSEYHGIYKAIGVLQGTYTCNTVPSYCLSKEDVVIDNIVYKSKLGAGSDYVGCNVEYYYSQEDKTVYAAVPYRSTKTIVDANDIFDYKGFTLYQGNENGKEIKYTLSVETQIIFNGDIIDEFSKSDLVGINGTLNLIDNGNDGVIDYIFIDSYEICVVQAVDLNSYCIYDKYSTSNNLYMNEKDPDFNIVFTDEANNSISLKEIVPGDVISYKKSKSGKKIRAYYNTSEIIGEIESVDTNDKSHKVLEINGRSYEVIKGFSDDATLQPGLQGKFRLTVDNRIAAVDINSLSMRYAYLITGIKSSSLSKKCDLKLYDQEGVMRELGLADYVTVDGAQEKADVAYSLLSTGDRINSQVIMYQLNKEGKISCIDTSKKEDAESDKTMDRYYSCSYDDNGDARPVPLKLEYRSIGIFGGRIAVDNTTIIFMVPEDITADEDEYAIINRDTFVHSYSYTVDAFKCNPDSYTAEALLYKKAESESEIPTTNEIALVDRVTKAIDADGYLGTKIYVMYNGNMKSLWLKDENVLNVDSLRGDGSRHNFAQGDVVRFLLNSTDKVIKIELVYDCKNDIFKYPSLESTSYIFSNYRVAKGEIYGIDSNVILFHKGEIDESEALLTYDNLELYKRFLMTVYLYDSNDSQTPLRVAGTEDFVEYRNTGKGSKVVMYVKNGQEIVMIIYK